MEKGLGVVADCIVRWGKLGVVSFYSLISTSYPFLYLKVKC